MAITGNLRTMQLSELLQWLSMGQKTGTLAIRGGSGEKRVYFQNGRIISSSSTIEREYLGHFLVSYGYITEEELTKAMEVQEESKILLGKILVMIGAIAEEDLVELIRIKACETIYDIFLWPEGAFHFIDGEIPQRPMIPIAIDVTGIVMEGLRRYDEWQRLKERIVSMRDIPSVVAQVAIESLGEPQRIILRAIDGVRSLAEIAEATHNPDFPVAKLVFDLLESGHLDLSSGFAPPRSSELTPEDPYETVFAEAATPHYSGVIDTADELNIPPPPDGRPAPAKDFTRFLRRGPDSGTHTTRPQGGPVTTSMSAPVAAPPPAPPPSTSFRPAPPVSAPVRPPATGSFQTTDRSAASFLEMGAPPSSVPWPPAPPPSGVFRPSRAAAPPPASVSFRTSQSLPQSPPPSQGSLSAPPSAGPASSSSIAVSAIPSLTRPMEELMSWSFTPNEAFILSRINGLWDIRSIAKISPFPEGEVRRVFEKLHDGGLIRWR
ncbi:MAG TPA: DUF4388 domain-containing protein [Thermoanaerobaculia bacterium]|nr:DUF4388 domain-containing protein [Thermoanaerobaculia bacterium]